MPTENDPIVDNWYFHTDKGQRFMVIDIDERNDLVEIQQFDGDIEALSLSDWHEMNIEISTEPQNWSGAIDVGEIDDYGTEVTDTQPDEWDEALNELQWDEISE